MKYYIRTANLECSMNQTFYKADFVAKKCKTIMFCKKPIKVFFLYTEVVNVLPSVLVRTSKKGKNVLVSFLHSKFNTFFLST